MATINSRRTCTRHSKFTLQRQFDYLKPVKRFHSRAIKGSHLNLDGIEKTEIFKNSSDRDLNALRYDKMVPVLDLMCHAPSKCKISNNFVPKKCLSAPDTNDFRENGLGND